MGKFRYFVIFAEMRTGSNLLESGLSAIKGITCFGELFNPYFVGGPKRDDVLGISLAARQENPDLLVDALLASDHRMPGFRLFHDHDGRVIDRVIRDPDCAKIILTRNPVDAFVSRKIAGATGQWRLGDMKDRRDAKITFDGEEFETYLDARQNFQAELRARLQAAGQPAFHVTYDDIQSVAAINGVAAYLGSDHRLDDMPEGIKKQNPGDMASKVENLATMQAYLSGFDWLDLTAAPLFEPERGPAVPRYLATSASGGTGILYLPIAGGPLTRVRGWMDGFGQDVQSGLTRKALRDWLRAHPGHVSFTVVRHPLARAYDAFQRRIVQPGEDQMGAVKRLLADRYGLDLPAPDAGPDDIRPAFLDFLGLLPGLLAGQTPLGVNPGWASQMAVIEGFSKVHPPARIIREDNLGPQLTDLGGDLPEPAPTPWCDLSAIYSGELEQAARRVYQRDYDALGYGDWAAAPLSGP